MRLHYALFELRCKTITSLTFYIHHSTSQKANRFENTKQSQFLSLFSCQAEIIIVQSIESEREK